MTIIIEPISPETAQAISRAMLVTCGIIWVGVAIVGALLWREYRRWK